MSNVTSWPSTDERKERRRLHLREVSETSEPPTPAVEPRDPTDLLGAVLRAARIERGDQIATIAAKLKMRADQLEALETNDFAKLPGRTYAVGFVRTYARHLGLDAEAMVQRFKDESAGRDFTKPVEHVFPEAQDEPRLLPNPSILVWAMLIAMVIYTISYLTMPSRRQATTAKAEEPVVVEQPTATKPVTEAVRDVWRPVSQEPETSYVAGKEVLPKTDAPTPTEILVDDRELPSATFAVAQVVDAQTNAAPAPAVQTQAAGASRITFKAVEQTYIQIKDPALKGGRGTLVSRVLQPGESYQAPDRFGLVMLTGNAGGIQVEVDGRVVGVLGKSGEVATRVPVDASYFLERIAASQ